MNSDNFVNILESLTRSWRECNDPDSGTQREIQMWREKFLNEKKPSRKVGIHFMAIPSKEFMKRSVEENLEICKELT